MSVTLPDWLKPDFLLKLIEHPRLLFAIWILGLFLLCLAAPWSDRFGFTAFHDQHRGIIGIVTLIALAVWVVQVGSLFFNYISSHLLHRHSKKEALQSIDTLSEPENLILWYCLIRHQRTIPLPLGNSAASSLRQKGLLELSKIGTHSTGLILFPCLSGRRYSNVNQNFCQPVLKT